MTIQTQSKTINGLELAWREPVQNGAGALVICLHGFPDSAHSFDSLLPVLAAQGCRVLSLHLRGYAPSALAASYDLPSLARDVLALIDELGAKQATLVGHDWGAVIAYAVAALRPDRIEQILVAAIPHLRRFLLRPTWAQLKKSRYMLAFQFWGAEKQFMRPMRLENLMQRWSPTWYFGLQDLTHVKANFADPARVKAALGYYRALPSLLFQGESWRWLLNPIDVPVHQLHGALDGCIGAEMFEDQAHLFLQSFERTTWPDAGHFVIQEQPERFVGWVCAALTALKPATDSAK
jgi:pimeloyl-ACP methyl ester carboxylesterase